MSTRKREKSPAQIARETLGLDRREGALAAGVSYHALYEIETGLATGISERVMKFFKQAGLDIEDLEERHRRWREKQGAGLRTRITEQNLEHASLQSGSEMKEKKEGVSKRMVS
jgi:hypothetical protein